MSPQTLWIGEGQRSGIDVTYTKSRRALYIGGWFDTFVGIEGRSLSLAEFFKELGITEADCRAAFKVLA